MATHSNTKSLAWHDYRASNKRNTSKGKVIKVLIENGNTPLNDRSLVEITNLEMAAINKAVNDLTNSGVLIYLVKPSKHTQRPVRHSFLKDYHASSNKNQ